MRRTESCRVWLAALVCVAAQGAAAQEPASWATVDSLRMTEAGRKPVFFQGLTLSADLYGPASYLLSDYGTVEAALRLNLRNTCFPIVEAGYGMCSTSDFNTKISYEAKAPYLRVGVDFNMLRNKFQGNRLYIGARWGVSVFKYDMAGPAMTDPVWGGSEALNLVGQDCTSHWAEFVLGVEVGIYKNLHMGWAVRYKRELASTKSPYAKPNCIPGYGYTTDSSTWGGTYSLIFDLNWGRPPAR